MKISFPTFCLFFLVTIVHLVLITLFSPLWQETQDSLGRLEEEPHSDSQMEEPALGLGSEGDGESTAVGEPAATDSQIVSNDEDEGLEPSRVTALLQGRIQYDEGSDSGPVTSEDIVAESMPGARTDSRALSGRVGPPDPGSLSVGGTKEGSEPDSRVGGSPSTSPGKKTSLPFREIRPL